MFERRNEQKRWLNYLIAALIISLVIIAILIAVALSGKGGGSGEVSLDDYQAVFLDNGQVYFGKVVNPHSDYVLLKDIYYIQLKQGLQSQQEDGTTAPPDITLIKLGKELHGPQDEMYITKEHVLFIENLKDDSKVLQAIKAHKDNQPQ